MLKSTGLILAAGGIVAANEIIFVPIDTGQPVLKSFNWRIIPATGILALTLGGLEKLSEPLGKGLAGLVLLVVLVVPVGNAPGPLDNAAKLMSGLQKNALPGTQHKKAKGKK